MTFVQEHLVGRVDFLQFYRDEGVAFPQGGKRGLCPFHDDNTPSFDVVPDTGLFKCRACGAGGDPVTFLGNVRRSTQPPRSPSFAVATGFLGAATA